MFEPVPVDIPNRPGAYVLHIEPRYGHAGHYGGGAPAGLAGRIGQHAKGNGANLVSRALAAGCKVAVVRMWFTEDATDARQLERSFKKQQPRRGKAEKGRGGETSMVRLCPRCDPHAATHHTRGKLSANYPQWVDGGPLPELHQPWADEGPPF